MKLTRKRKEFLSSIGESNKKSWTKLYLLYLPVRAMNNSSYSQFGATYNMYKCSWPEYENEKIFVIT